jgi:PAS domain-containing protein
LTTLSPEQTLRDRAEERLRTLEDQELETLSPEEIRRTLHELRVHQIEIEIQNEELRRTLEELDATSARYFNLYDLAPVGYCTLDENGLILEANLTAATLLGAARGTLIGRPISGDSQGDHIFTDTANNGDTGIPQAIELGW